MHADPQAEQAWHRVKGMASNEVEKWRLIDKKISGR